MPIVKSYDNLTVSKQVAPTVTARAPQVINTTKPLLQGIDNLNKGFQIYQEGVDETFSNDAYLQFQKERNKFLNDPDEGFFNLKGKNPYNNKDKALQQYNKLKSKYASQMRGTAGEKLKLLIEQASISDINQIDRHVATQFEAYKTQTSLDGIAVSSETAVINYNDPEKANRAISDALSYAKTEAMRKGLEPGQAIQSTMNDIVTKQVVNALLTEDVDGAKDLLKRYGSNVEGIRNLLEAKITKVEEDIYKRGEDERVASKALDVYQSTGGNYALAMRKINADKSTSADEKFKLISKVNNLNEASNRIDSKNRENLMSVLDRDVVMGGQSLTRWINQSTQNRHAWENVLTSAQRHRYIRMTKSGSGSGSAKIAKDPNLLGQLDAAVASGNKALTRILIEQYGDSIPDSDKRKATKFLNTEDIKTVTPSQLPPQIKAIYQSLDKKEQSDYMVAFNAAYVARQTEQEMLPDNDDMVTIGRSVLDTYEEYKENIDKAGYSLDGNNYSALRKTTVSNFIGRLSEQGITGVKEEEVLQLVDSYIINNKGKLPNMYNISEMVDKEVAMRQPVIVQLKTGGFLAIDRKQNGGYITNNDELINLYKQNNSIGKVFDSYEKARGYTVVDPLRTTGKEKQIENKPETKPEVSQDDTTSVMSEVELKKALVEARNTLDPYDIEPYHKKEDVLDALTTLGLGSIDNMVDTINTMGSINKATKVLITTYIKGMTDSLNDFNTERGEKMHKDLVQSFMKDNNVFVAQLIFQDPYSTPEEKKIANAYLFEAKYGR